MDKQYSVKFFTSFIEAMQKLCREYLDFEQGVELSGYLAVEIDNFKKERYVLSELVQSTGNVISESYCTKAFKTLRKEPQRVSNVHGSENIAPRDHMNRTGRSHSEEVTIILRDSPETVSRHSNFPLHTTPHKSSSNSQRHAFHHNPRAHTFSRHKDSAAVSVSNPFEMSPSSRGQQHQQPFEIQPRCSESLQVLPNLSPKTPQKRNIGDVDSAHLSPIPKKDKIDHIGSGIESLLAATDNVNDTHADMDSMQNIYSTSATATTTTSVSDSLHTTIDCSSQPASDENLRLPIGMDIKREKDDDSSFMIIENPSDPTVKLLEAEGMFGGERESSQTLGLDTSTSFSADSQSADHGDFKDSGSLGDMAGTSWDSSNQIKKFACEECGKRFSSRFSLKRHGIRHTMPIENTCNKCGKVFISRDNLEGHMSSEHAAPKRFHCDRCGLEFVYKKNLKYHQANAVCEKQRIPHYPDYIIPK
ncbi:zinc finger protein 181-like isoform X3 [Gigantopelta aegis]|uniref:zinc finger protein 181-like isoform X3 n=1 Tax=Gigantopelta aegis TaxID=1735272 RepID=UPI001B88934E|nr:zinc finger protein 181-like isoform X3 [Gigantopelta aegis]